MPLYTLPGYALVKLASSKYKHVEAPTKIYEAASTGTLIDINARTTEHTPRELSDYRKCIGTTVYWDELNAKSPIIHNNENYAYVKVQDLMGGEVFGREKL